MQTNKQYAVMLARRLPWVSVEKLFISRITHIFTDETNFNVSFQFNAAQ